MEIDLFLHYFYLPLPVNNHFMNYLIRVEYITYIFNAKLAQISTNLKYCFKLTEIRVKYISCGVPIIYLFNYKNVIVYILLHKTHGLWDSLSEFLLFCLLKLIEPIKVNVF